MDFLNFKLKIIFIINVLFFNLNLYSDIYILSYKSVLKKGQIVSENFQIAKSMKNIDEDQQEAIGVIELDGKRTESDRQILLKNKDKIVEILSSLFGVSLSDHSLACNLNLTGSSQTTYIISPTRVLLERDQFGANLIILK